MLLTICSHLIGFCFGATFAVVMLVCMMRSIFDLNRQFERDFADRFGSSDTELEPEPLRVQEIDAGTFCGVDLEILKTRRVMPANAPHSDTPTGSFPVYSSPERIERLPVNYVYDGDVAWFEATDDSVAALIAGDTYFVGT